MVEGILDSLIDEVRANSRDRKLPKNFDEKNFREENRAYAIWQAKWILLKEQIAEAEHISVSDEEVEKLAEADASRLGIAKDRMIQYYKSSDGTKDRLLTEKITAFLLDRAKITERIVEEPVAK
jgi:FKBP-type peptidyl-prolyl cis-trans isomerase (trigger factor)